MSPGDETQVVSKSPCNDNSECPAWVKYKMQWFRFLSGQLSVFYRFLMHKWKYVLLPKMNFKVQSLEYWYWSRQVWILHRRWNLFQQHCPLQNWWVDCIVNNWLNHCHIDFIHHHLDSIAVSLFTNTVMAMLFTTTTTTTISTTTTTSTTITTAINIILLITRLSLCNPWWLSRGLLFGPLRTRLWRLGIICKTLLLFEIQRYDSIDLLNYFVGSFCFNTLCARKL